MRLSVVLCALAGLSLAVGPATAQKSYSKKGYSSCYCDYGYPGYSCVPVVSCLDEGGGAEERVRANMSRSQYRIQVSGLLQLAKIALAPPRAIAITIPSAQ
jgi:hypothetical protein